ncbi:MAG: sugar phosphate nucleotidyltransferase [Bacteroidota bacterium]
MITERLTEQSGRLAIIMAGGLGSRLGDLSEGLPKPLIELSGKPILEHSILHLKKFGFTRFIISVKYKADLVKAHFGQGKKWEISISYVEEPDDFLGTAGPLGLMKSFPSETFLLINGDVLTSLNFNSLWQYHLEKISVATMCVREHAMAYPYGIVEGDEGELTSINEKPVLKHLINAGIYLLEPSVLNYIPAYEYMDVTELFDILLQNSAKPSIYRINEKWIDIGTPEDYYKARALFFPSITTHVN